MKLNIIGSSKIWFTISATVVVVSLVAIASFGLKLGIDFTGGGEGMYEFEQEVTQEKIAEVASAYLLEIEVEGSIVAQKTNKDSAFILRGRQLTREQRNGMIDALETELGAVEESSYESIGPVVGNELKRKTIQALIYSMIAIVLFVTFAFRKIPKHLSSWRFGITAIIALVHDVIIVVGVFAALGYFLNVEMDSLFITALLTIMGFSVHDTIVTFDRLRENVILNPNGEFGQLANKAINETIVRSINTSVTTIITLSFLFVLGGESIRWFVLALLLGIVVGTYSSVFLATPVLVSWHNMAKKKK